MSVVDFEALVQPGIRALRAYDPGHDLVAMRRRYAAGALVELGSNENAYGPAPGVRDAVLATLPMLHRYPDPLGGDLKRALSTQLDTEPTRLLLGNGSHELLLLLAQAFAGPGSEVLVSRYGFAVYALAAQTVGAQLRVAEAFGRDAPMPLGHDLGAVAAAITPATRLVYLANPNNPTGTWFTRDELEELLQRTPASTLVVVDEAYAEYVDADGPRPALALSSRYPNLVVTRTFSKAHGLAGLRVGYAVADAQVIALLERLRESFNVNAVGLAAAEAALADRGHVRRVNLANAGARATVADALRARGLQVLPSQTNFLLACFGSAAHAAAAEAALLAAGVVPRPMAGYGLGDCLRITISTPDENRRLLEALPS